MFVATDKNGEEFIYSSRPSRGNLFWVNNGTQVKVSKGTIQRLLNYPLTWDDEAEEIVEYKNKDLKEDKVIKRNIKMRVTPEQSRKVQEICFENGIVWKFNLKKISHISEPYLAIEPTSLFYRSTENDYFSISSLFKEVDADLFIRTNGSCEDTTLNDQDIKKYESKNYQGSEAELLLSKMIDFKDEEYIKLEKKVFNLKKQLEKYVVKIANQKEELTRLLLQKEDLQNRLNISNKTVVMSIDSDIELIRLLEEKDAIIKYLENKLEI